jgi:hypothetical protein
MSCDGELARESLDMSVLDPSRARNAPGVVMWDGKPWGWESESTACSDPIGPRAARSLWVSQLRLSPRDTRAPASVR